MTNNQSRFPVIGSSQVKELEPSPHPSLPTLLGMAIPSSSSLVKPYRQPLGHGERASEAGNESKIQHVGHQLPPKGQTSSGYTPQRTFWSNGFPPDYDSLHEELLDAIKSDPKSRASRQLQERWDQTYIHVQGPTAAFRKNPYYVWVLRSDWDLFKTTERPHFQPPGGDEEVNSPTLSHPPPVQDPRIPDGRPGGNPRVIEVTHGRNNGQPTTEVVMSGGTHRATQRRKKSSPSSKGPNPPSSRVPAAAFVYSARRPKIQSTADQSVITHAELLKSVYAVDDSSTPGKLNISQTYSLNPGLQSSFPWLATQAANWERYEFKKLIFHYMPSCAYIEIGKVIMAPDFDPADSAPASKQVAFTYEQSKFSVPYKGFSVNCPRHMLHPSGPKFVRTAGISTNPPASINDYDAGNVFVCVVDNGSGSHLLGDVWVEYQVVLTQPQSSPLGFATGQTGQSTGSTVTTANNFGTNTAQFGSKLVTVPASGNILTSLIEGSIVINLVTLAATSATKTGDPTPSSDSSLDANYGLFAGGSGTATLVQAMQWNAKIGSTLTFNNTIVGTTTCFLNTTSSIPL